MGAFRLGSAGYPFGRVVRRFALTTGAVAVNAAANLNAGALTGPNILLPVVDPTQAIRIVSCFARVADAGATHFLTMLGARLQLALANFATQTPNQQSVRAFQPFYGPLLLVRSGRPGKSPMTNSPMDRIIRSS